jgi:PAS domain S-box-containing protein
VKGPAILGLALTCPPNSTLVPPLNIERLSTRHLVAFIAFFSFLVAVLAIAWKFGIEEEMDPFLPGEHNVDSLAERWEFVVVTALLSALALVAPAIVIRRLISTRFEASRRMADMLLAASEQKYRQLFETGQVCVLVLDVDGRFVMLNEQSARALGGVPGDFVGRTIAEKFPTTADYYLLHFSWVFREKKGIKLDESLSLPDGVHWYSASLEPIFDANGEVTGIQVVAIDITDRKASEQALLAAKAEAERSNDVKSRFLAAASHDLRQPLQSITLLSDALARSGLDDAQRRTVDLLDASTRSMADLLEALLDISRFDAGDIASTLAPVAATDLIERIAAELHPSATVRGLELKTCCPARDLSLLTDEKLLRSLLRTLVGNAIKFTERGRILVAVRRRGNQALVQVRDSGIGIAPEHAESIFEDYFQVDNPARDRGKGLGLGLPIASRIARLIGSELSCRSRPGHGSVFEFRLPLASERPGGPAPTSAPKRTALPLRDIGVRHIALIDDEPMLARALQLALASDGIQVRTFGSAEAALADPDIMAADFYISDYRLPGMNGVQLLDTLQRRATHAIKAILLTGDLLVDQGARPLLLKWKVLDKPIDQFELVAAIAAFVRKPPLESGP